MWLKETFRALSANPKMSLAEQGALWNLLKYAWDKQGIIETDLHELARTLREPLEIFTFIWPDFLALAEEKNGAWMTSEMWESVEKQKIRIDAAKNAGKLSAEARLQKTKDLEPTVAQRLLNGSELDLELDLDIENTVAKTTSKPKEKSKQGKKNSQPQAEGFNAAPFLEIYQKQHGATCEIAYKLDKADAGQLKALWNHAQSGGKSLALADWERAVKNYFASPVGVRSICQLATYKNFIAYFQNPLNEFGKPVIAVSPAEAQAAAAQARPRYPTIEWANRGGQGKVVL